VRVVSKYACKIENVWVHLQPSAAEVEGEVAFHVLLHPMQSLLEIGLLPCMCTDSGQALQGLIEDHKYWRPAHSLEALKKGRLGY
jgi:hypothetical protein